MTKPLKPAERRLEIIYRDPFDLKADPRNARTHSPEQIEQLRASIREFGFTNPVLLRPNGMIGAGHGRVEAAKAEKLALVPTCVIEGLTDDQWRAYVLADNKLALNAGWDEDLLRQELRALDELEINLADLFKTPTGRTDPNEAPETPVVSTSRRGDVWLLGDHRLMVGDATDKEDIAALMAGAQADMVWTDPPYNVAVNGKAGTIINDDMAAAAFRTFLDQVFASYLSAMRPGAVIYVSHSETERAAFTASFQEAGLKLSQCLIWVKQSGTLTRQDYNWRHEPILYGWKEGAGHYFAGDFTKTTVIEDDIDVTKMTKPQLLAAVQAFLAAQRDTILRHDRPTRSDLHPTMKPVALVQDMIEASSLPSERVLDLFGGSGTTLIACERSGRRAALMELDPRFGDVTVRRWEEFTGRVAILEATGQTFRQVAEERGEQEAA
jgi:DNA modification methylase